MLGGENLFINCFKVIGGNGSPGNSFPVDYNSTSSRLQRSVCEAEIILEVKFMARISSGIFNRWLSRYGTAWEEGNPQKIGDLFAEEASYQITPFSNPLVGRDAIQEYWQAGPANKQKDVSFSFRILSVRGNEGIAHWQAKYKRVDGENFVELDGLLVAEFDDNGACTEFREWWHRREDRDEDRED